MTYGAGSQGQAAQPGAAERLAAVVDRLRPVLVAVPAAGLLAGAVAWFAGSPTLGETIWAIATVPVIAALAAEIASGLLRRDVGLDIVAFLSMSGGLLLQQSLAAVVVAIMYAGGQFLESYALGRARRELRALLERSPRSAMRYSDGRLAEVPIDVLAPGDRVLVRQGEVVPADGTVADGVAVLDQSALTGEAMPVRVARGEPVMSGSTNAGAAFDLIAERPAADSTYAGIVRLVEAAARAKAPIVRLADRFALLFLVVTLTLAGGAWLASGDPIRWLAVMVVATPCPLILAVPVAIVAGMSRTARIGVLVKGGGVLETMARVNVVVIDKTGTLTEGRATLSSLAVANGFDEDSVLRAAASLDQASGHVIAKALVDEAHRRGLALSLPREVHEEPGSGLEGTVDGRRVVVGGRRFVAERLAADATFPRPALGKQVVAVAIDGRPAGTFAFTDPIRPEVPVALAEFRASGVDRIVLASGDTREVSEAVAAQLDVDAVEGELSPEQKLATIAREKRSGTLMMIGDGINDAPALAAADVGVAMGARGAAASSEAADAVLMVDRLDRVAAAMRIAQRARTIALQSVVAGLGLSFAGMLAAAFGYLPPVQGALVQEAIDIAVILNALRALGDGPPTQHTEATGGAAEWGLASGRRSAIEKVRKERN